MRRTFKMLRNRGRVEWRLVARAPPSLMNDHDDRVVPGCAGTTSDAYSHIDATSLATMRALKTGDALAAAGFNELRA